MNCGVNCGSLLYVTCLAGRKSPGIYSPTWPVSMPCVCYNPKKGRLFDWDIAEKGLVAAVLPNMVQQWKLCVSHRCTGLSMSQ